VWAQVREAARFGRDMLWRSVSQEDGRGPVDVG
jgi:hypothetical protein